MNHIATVKCLIKDTMDVTWWCSGFNDPGLRLKSNIGTAPTVISQFIKSSWSSHQYLSFVGTLFATHIRISVIESNNENDFVVAVVQAQPSSQTTPSENFVTERRFQLVS